MSVRTTADEMLDDVRKHIEKAIKVLVPVVYDQNLYGHNDLREDYVDTLEEVLTTLRSIRKKV